jgi:hypothetical protein
MLSKLLRPWSLSSFGPYIVHLICLTSKKGYGAMERKHSPLPEARSIVRVFIPHHNLLTDCILQTQTLKHTYILLTIFFPSPKLKDSAIKKLSFSQLEALPYTCHPPSSIMHPVQRQHNTPSWTMSSATHSMKNDHAIWFDIVGFKQQIIIY